MCNMASSLDQFAAFADTVRWILATEQDCLLFVRAMVCQDTFVEKVRIGITEEVCP